MVLSKTSHPFFWEWGSAFSLASFSGFDRRCREFLGFGDGGEESGTRVGFGAELEERMRNIGELASALDKRVGQGLKAWRHEEANSLYVEQVDVGEAKPRIICSGPIKYVPLQELQVRKTDLGESSPI
ncbi:hypothetical protein BT93_L2508 [Corymbia citriodora subsp. variegata]|uniref:tRNA-binding domain-containing protein n=1 Tax=Corymbia citriodora subsp. variegata TaxID=360336 RepID=A0A8T0CJK7_CORYI|nr:hypothetical protein BT93_L2508 [Corymbia citriodora subsp. variegata]